MAEMSYNDYVAMTAKTPARNTMQANQPLVRYFSLADDRDEAVVRFDVQEESDLKVCSLHRVEVNGRMRSVNCLKTSMDDVDSCPFCAAGEKLLFRVYVKLLRYDVEDGKMTVTPVVWERNPKFIDTLKPYLESYGNLRNHLFKIIRQGKKGDPSTTYLILPLGNNSPIYNDRTCLADFSVLDEYNPETRIILKRSKEDIETFLKTGDFPAPQRQSASIAPAPTTPVAPAPAAPVVEPAPQPAPTNGPRRYTF